MERTYSARLGNRAERVGVLEPIESPITVVVLVGIWTWGSAVNTALIAAVFFWFGEPEAGWISVGLAVIYLSGWFVFTATGRVRRPFILSVGASLIGVPAIHVLMGGYAYSGAFFYWTAGVMVVFVLLLPRSLVVAAGVYVLALAVIFGFGEQSLQASRDAPDPALPAFFFAYTLAAVVLLLIPVLRLLLDRLRHERERAERLLLNVLPAPVATELKTGTTPAQRFDSVSVLFADIVGFTPLSAAMDPEEMVDQLNEVFTHFDSLADRYGAEKIRTIGDSYMVAAGVPVPRQDHAQLLARMALDMIGYSDRGSLSFRIGINSGPVVAGVIGLRKFQYDIWGDTVNTASRMESHGEPGRIQISDTTNELIADTFTTTRRGPIQVKGKGTLTTWWLERETRLVTADQG